VRRREFITLLGGAAAPALLGSPVVRSQQPAMPVIGYFSGRSADVETPYAAWFRQGLEESGYVEGHNVAIEFRFSNGQDDRLPALAADLVRRDVAVLVATDTASALAAKAATTTIPIVFGTGADPVQLRLVESLNRPNSNATGVGVFVTQLGPKRLQMLQEIVPDPRLIAFVANPKPASGPLQIREMQAAAQAIGQQLLVLNASTDREVDEAFVTIVERKAAGIGLRPLLGCHGLDDRPWAPRGSLAYARLCSGPRGCNGGVRQELAAGVSFAT
jgi:putative ABC transport system substrate-binding protein